jgi:hypothetical protein
VNSVRKNTGLTSNRLGCTAVLRFQYTKTNNKRPRSAHYQARPRMDKTDTRPKFDFDAWAKLARKDPEAFELERNLLVERAIMRAPPDKQQRLRCLQWKLDQIRNLASTPMAACLQINQLLWEHIVSEHGLLHCLQRLQSGKHPVTSKPTPAKILQFQSRVSASLPPSDE